jgi:hypothetical protein
MNAYFDTLKFMMILMLILFFFSSPAMYIYSNYNALQHETMYMFTRLSLGNLGNDKWITLDRRCCNYMLICPVGLAVPADVLQVWHHGGRQG